MPSKLEAGKKLLETGLGAFRFLASKSNVPLRDSQLLKVVRNTKRLSGEGRTKVEIRNIIQNDTGIKLDRIKRSKDRGEQVIGEHGWDKFFDAVVPVGQQKKLFTKANVKAKEAAHTAGVYAGMPAKVAKLSKERIAKKDPTHIIVQRQKQAKKKLAKVRRGESVSGITPEWSIRSALGIKQGEQVPLVKALAANARARIGLKANRALMPETEIAEAERLLLPTQLRTDVLTKAQKKFKPYLGQMEKTEQEIASLNLAEKDLKVEKIISDIMEFLGSNPYYAYKYGWQYGHKGAIKANIENFIKSNHPLAKSLSKEIATHPRYLTMTEAEFSLLNLSSDAFDKALITAIREGKATKQGLGEMQRFYKDMGIESIMPGLEGEMMTMGQHNPLQQLAFLKAMAKRGENPFKILGKTQKKQILRGSKTLEDLGYTRVPKYAEGGIVNGYNKGGKVMKLLDDAIGMMSRRKFLKGTGATALSTVLPKSALKLAPTAIKKGALNFAPP